MAHTQVDLPVLERDGYKKGALIKAEVDSTSASMGGGANVAATAAGPKDAARSRCSSASVSAADGVGLQPLPRAAATSSSADTVSGEKRLWRSLKLIKRSMHAQDKPVWRTNIMQI